MRKLSRKSLIVLSVALCLLLVSCCSTGNKSQILQDSTPKEKYWPGDEWRKSTPEEQEIDSKSILEMKKNISDNIPGIKSFLLIRNGYMIDETYFDSSEKGKSRNVYSVTKSVISALVGIAIEDGLITGPDQKIVDLLKDEDKKGVTAPKTEITVENILTMTSGLKIANSTDLPNEGNVAEYVLGLPMTNRTGGSFIYTSGAPQLLSAAIMNVTGKNTADYAAEKLFQPIGITLKGWQKDQGGVPMGGFGLELTPEDMARLGYLYLREGEWNGSQIISKEWIRISTQKQKDTTGVMNYAEDYGYGYMWWINHFGGYSAHGTGGQYIFIIPEKDLVAVFTSDLNWAEFPTPYELMEKHVLPAVRK